MFLQPIKSEPQEVYSVFLWLGINQIINTLPVCEEFVHHSGAGRDNQLNNHLETEKQKIAQATKVALLKEQSNTNHRAKCD